MVVINKISPEVEFIKATTEHEIIDALMSCFDLSYKLSSLLYGVFISCPKLIIRNTKNVPTQDLYQSNMAAGVISGASGLELVLSLKHGDDTYYIVDFIDVGNGKVQLAMHRLQDSIVKDAVRAYIRGEAITDILKEIEKE